MAELTAQQLEILARNARETATMFEEMTRAGGPKAEADRLAAEEAKRAADNLKYWTGVVGRSAVDFSKAMLTGGEGTGKFGSSITGVTDAVGNAAGKFGVLGMAAGGLIKIFGAVAAASLKQNDTIMKAYRDLSEAGSVSGSLEQLKDDLGRVGLTSEEVDKFGAMLKKNTPDIAAFGGSVTAGKEKLIGVIQGMIGPNNEIERAMSRIGYGAEEMRDATADYIAKQSRLGVSQTKTEEQLRNESVKYMQTLRELQELTGMSRDEAQKIMDQQQNEYRYANYLRELEMQGKTKEAENLRSYMASYEKTFGKQAATDLMEQIVNKGAAVGEASVRSMLSTQNKGYQNAMKAQKGQIDMYDGLKDTAAGMRRNMNQLGTAYNSQGQAINQQVGSQEQLNGMLLMESKTREEIADRLEDDQNKEGDRLDKNTRMEQQQRAMRVAADRALWEAGNGVVSMFEKLTQIMFKFGKFLAQVIDFISPTVLGKQTNLAASFRDNEDVQKDKAAAIKEKESLSKQKEELLKQIALSEKANGYQTAYQDKLKQIRDLEAKGKNLTGEEAEKNKAAVRAERLELQELNRLIAADKNTTSESRLQEKRKQILEIDEKLQAEDKRLQQLEKENIQTGGTSQGNQPPVAKSTPTGPVTKFDGNQKEFYDQMYNILLAEAKKQKLENPEAVARLGASQASLETGYGKHSVGHNYFGIKDTSGKGNRASTQEYDSKTGRMVTVDQNFRGYGSMEESAKDYLRFLQENKRYAKVLAAKTPEEAINEQSKTGYATDPRYGNKLSNIHERSKLPQASGGGIFEGPKSGYPVMLHGKEAVVPMPNIQNFMDDIKKESLASLDANNQANKQPSITMPKIDFSGLEQIMSETLVSKFEDMISQLETANDKLGDILKHAKA
jgi:flagellum-specific peptidoglycan hydrolase FlgJ